VGVALVAAAAEPRPSETEVKAEFVERFTRFIDWPPSAFSSDGAPFVVCTTDSAFQTALEKVVSRGVIQRHHAVVRPIDEPAATDGCQIVYLAPRTNGQLSVWLKRASGRPILTVGDTPGYGDRGTFINMYMDTQARVRFEVNIDTMKHSGLRVSSQLLRLARLVGERP
jgi:hypothetical protein